MGSARPAGRRGVPPVPARSLACMVTTPVFSAAMSPGSMICPSCGKLIGVGEEKCPFCGAWQPGMFGAAPALQRWFGGRLDLTPMIVTACIVLYVASLALD